MIETSKDMYLGTNDLFYNNMTLYTSKFHYFFKNNVILLTESWKSCFTYSFLKVWLKGFSIGGMEAVRTATPLLIATDSFDEKTAYKMMEKTIMWDEQVENAFFFAGHKGIIK